MKIHGITTAITVAAALLSASTAQAQNGRRAWSTSPTAAKTTTVFETSWGGVLYQLQRRLSSYQLSYYAESYRDYASQYYYGDSYGNRNRRDYYTTFPPNYYYGDVQPRYRVSRAGNTVVIRTQPSIEYIVVTPRYTPARLPR